MFKRNTIVDMILFATWCAWFLFGVGVLLWSGSKSWPPRFPDLWHCKFSFIRYLKKRVWKETSRTLEYFKWKNIAETHSISRQMLKEEGASPEDLDTSIEADEQFTPYFIKYVINKI